MCIAKYDPPLCTLYYQFRYYYEWSLCGSITHAFLFREERKFPYLLGIFVTHVCQYCIVGPKKQNHFNAFPCSAETDIAEKGRAKTNRYQVFIPDAANSTQVKRLKCRFLGSPARSSFAAEI